MHDQVWVKLKDGRTKPFGPQPGRQFFINDNATDAIHVMSLTDGELDKGVRDSFQLDDVDDYGPKD